jgi:putative ABC transport system permease protein
MKSIGAENKKIASLFFTEASIIGVIGGVFGYLVGMVAAQFIGMSVFETSITPRLEVMPVAIGISVGVALLASALPVRRATRIEPAIVLRGE